MTPFWIWVVVTGLIAFICLLLAVLSVMDEEFDVTVLTVRGALFSWLWPLALVYAILAVAFNRNPFDPRERMSR